LPQRSSRWRGGKVPASSSCTHPCLSWINWSVNGNNVWHLQSTMLHACVVCMQSVTAFSFDQYKLVQCDVTATLTPLTWTWWLITSWLLVHPWKQPSSGRVDTAQSC
jgi:hypothetical protein